MAAKKKTKKAAKKSGKKTVKKAAKKTAKKAAKKTAKKATKKPAKKAAPKSASQHAATASLPAAPATGPKKYPKSIFSGSPVIQKEGSQIRVLIGKAGLDGHDRGAKVIARACRDAGFEVVYTGLHQTPEMIVNTAIQEDVDVLGLSILSGAHNYLVPEVIRQLRTQGIEVGRDILIVVGGIIPDSDFKNLKDHGVSMVFTPGTSVDSIVEYIRAHVKPKA
jgi:methylmalonyl-CoA mutase, C-terminal domain